MFVMKTSQSCFVEDTFTRMFAIHREIPREEKLHQEKYTFGPYSAVFQSRCRWEKSLRSSQILDLSH